MSLVYITNHDESIYDCAEKEPEKVIKPEKYVSIHRRRINSERKIDVPYHIEPNTKILFSRAALSSHKTMGYSETPLRPPCEYLRKNSGVKFAKIPAHYCDEQKPPLPPIPKRNEQGKLRREPKDFPNMNIETTRKLVAKKPTPKHVCTRNGLSLNLIGSGLTPCYILTEKYGKVPKYLSAMKKCVNKCYSDEIERQPKKPEVLPDGIRALSDNEIREIVLGLKKNWMDLTQKFNALPVFIDTIPKQNRKHKLEQQLREIEQDILLLEKHPTIYVCEA